jgi:hypothetical protein
MKRHCRMIAAALVLIMALAGASFAAEPNAERITSGEIETYARASFLVRSIRNDLAKRMPSAYTPQQAAMLVDAANSAMAWVVENEGLSLDRYNEIARAARASPDLRRRILEIMARLR